MSRHIEIAVRLDELHPHPERPYEMAVVK